MRKKFILQIWSPPYYHSYIIELIRFEVIRPIALSKTVFGLTPRCLLLQR